MKMKTRCLAFALAVIMIVSMMPLGAITVSAASAPSGYTNNSSTDKVAYIVRNNNSIDVRGYYNSQWIKTTYSNNGYTYMTAASSGSMSVTQTAAVVNGGNYVKLTYKVTAGSSGVTGGKLGVHADVMIGDNDYATVSVVYNNGRPVGLQMTDVHTSCSSKNAQYRLYFDGVAGVTPVSTYWMGRYGDRQNNCYSQIASSSVSGIDSGLAVSWQNINLSAGETKDFSIILGVGEVQLHIETPAVENSFSLVGNASDPAKMDVQMTYVDANPGVTDSLMYSIGGNEYTLNTATATGSVQAISGTADLSALSDGTYPISFWILNSNGAISSDQTRNVVIENGKIVGGLDAAIADVKLNVNSNEWTYGSETLLIGTSIDTALPNGSVVKNGPNNVYLNGHLIGTFQMNGGYTAPIIDWTPIKIVDVEKPTPTINEGTAATELELPQYISAVTEQGITVQVKVEWNHQIDVYEPDGEYTVYGTPTEVVGYEGCDVEDLFDFDAPVFAVINVLHVHHYTPAYTEPTCTTPGSKSDNCACGSRINVLYIPALGHNYESEVIKAATCAEPGSIKYTCTNEGCGHSYTVDTYAEHDYEITVIEPSCTVDGATTYTCAECGDINIITIPASHSYTSEITKPATRYEDGEIKYTCSVCGDFYTEVIPASNANILVIQDRIPWSVNNIPTLLNDMKDKGYIDGWTMTTTEKINTLELSSFDVVLIANDQTTATYNQLQALDSMITDFVSGGGTVIYGACDHGWASGDISFDILGSVEKTDFYSKRNYIVDATHPIVTGSLTDDRALTNDLLLGTYCSHSGFVTSTLPVGYNTILQDSQGNATLVEYNLGSGRVILSGLTWEFYYSRIYTGTTSYSKNVFDDLIVYAANPENLCEHKYDSGVIVNPSCETDGYTLHTCSECGSIYKDSFVPALGHEMGEWIVDSEPDCVKSGSQHQTCTRCGEIVTSVIPVIGHTTSAWIVDREPAPPLDGLRHKECTVCHSTLVEESYRIGYYVINNHIYYYNTDGIMTEDGINSFSPEGYITGNNVFITVNNNTYYIVNNTVITNYYVINNQIYYFGDDGVMTDDGVNSFSPDGHITGNNVFITVNNNTYYIVNNTVITNYYVINNQIYYFGDDGVMTDDGVNSFSPEGYIAGNNVFVTVNNNTYYIVNNTVITNYYVINNQIYYFGDDGVMTDDGVNSFAPEGYITGNNVFVTVNNNTYYIVNNTVITNYYVINNQIYYFGDDGVMTDDGVNSFSPDGYIAGNNVFVTVNNNTYYIVNNTVITNYYVINNQIYYFGDDGVMTDDGVNSFSPDGHITGNNVFITVNNNTYYIVNNTVITNYYVINNQIYYFGDDGVMTDDGVNSFSPEGYIAGNNVFITVNNNTYYIVNNTVITNYYVINNQIYYFGDDGVMTDDGVNSFAPEGYIAGNNVFVTVNNNTYYIVNNTVITNYYVINNQIYYFGDDGVMTEDEVNNFSPDGYIKGNREFVVTNDSTYYLLNNTIVRDYFIINNHIYYFGTSGKMTGDGMHEFSADGYLMGHEIFVTINNNDYYVVNNLVSVYVGDLDGDFEISDWDGILLKRYLAGWSVSIIGIDGLDIDGDGEITDWDGILLDRYLAGWIVNVEIG